MEKEGSTYHFVWTDNEEQPNNDQMNTKNNQNDDDLEKKNKSS